MTRFFLLLVSVLVLSACGGSQQTVFTIGSNHNSVTLVREQAYYGSEWSTEMVVARLPACQRRHLLKPVASDGFKMDVYQPSPGVFIFNQAKRWYVADLGNCELQQYKEPPPEPGDPVGTFQTRNGDLTWVDKRPKAEAGAVAPAPTPAGQ